MSKLRPEITLATLNALGEEYLPGYLGIQVTELAQGTASSRMPVRKLHFAPNDFLHAASVVALARTTQVWDAVVSDEASGRKLALFRCTQMILWPKNTVERT